MPVVVADPALRSDPARNFKFHVSFTKKLAADEQVVMTGGFMSVSGFGWTGRARCAPDPSSRFPPA